jgi:RNA polymerase sigma-70 factor (sigma-E family)
VNAESEQEYVDYVSARLPRLHRAAYLLSGGAHRADDVVQATVTVLYRHWRRARSAENIDAYVHRMLVRQFLDERRRGWSKVLLSWVTPDRPAPAASPVEDRDIVYRALRELPRGQREVLVLRFLCDLSIEDTAVALRCSTGNVKAQTSRALEAMREILAGSWS